MTMKDNAGTEVPNSTSLWIRWQDLQHSETYLKSTLDHYQTPPAIQGAMFPTVTDRNVM